MPMGFSGVCTTYGKRMAFSHTLGVKARSAFGAMGQ